MAVAQVIGLLRSIERDPTIAARRCPRPSSLTELEVEPFLPSSGDNPRSDRGEKDR